MKKLLSALVSVFMLASVAVAATPDIRLGTPGYGGTGCPGGSASVTLAPDRKSLSIIFDQYVAQAGGSTGSSLDRKSCNIAIPVHVPQGFSISVFQVDYRGYVNVPVGGEARFHVEYFFAGQRGPVSNKTWNGPADTDYLLTNNIIASALVWSACGQSVNLRVNSSMLAKTGPTFEDAMATVDTMDVRSGIIYHIQWRTCR